MLSEQGVLLGSKYHLVKIERQDHLPYAKTLSEKPKFSLFFNFRCSFFNICHRISDADKIIGHSKAPKQYS